MLDEKIMNYEDYKLGDKVVIRSKEALIAEFGFDEITKEIPARVPLGVGMHAFCNKILTIKEISYRCTDGVLIFKVHENGVTFSADVILCHDFKYNQKILVSDDAIYWQTRYYRGTIDGRTQPCIHFASVGKEYKRIINSYNFAKPIRNEIEITVKVNGKEVQLSDIPEDTLLKIWSES